MVKGWNLFCNMKPVLICVINIVSLGAASDSPATTVLKTYYVFDNMLGISKGFILFHLHNNPSGKTFYLHSKAKENSPREMRYLVYNCIAEWHNQNSYSSLLPPYLGLFSALNFKSY